MRNGSELEQSTKILEVSPEFDSFSFVYVNRNVNVIAQSLQGECDCTESVVWLSKPSPFLEDLLI